MDKLRFVVDNNVLVSSILIASSPPDTALKKIRSLGNILYSLPTFQELQEILNRPKFDRYVSLNPTFRRWELNFPLILKK